MSEPPARSFPFDFKNSGPSTIFQHWHYAPESDWHTVPNSVDSPKQCLPGDGRKFISPIVFVDSHVAVHDFSRVIRSDPDYAFEPTKDWSGINL
jgi:hypothetical protein